MQKRKPHRHIRTRKHPQPLQNGEHIRQYNHQREKIKTNRKYMEYGYHRVSQFIKAGISPITPVQNQTTDLYIYKSHI